VSREDKLSARGRSTSYWAAEATEPSGTPLALTLKLQSPLRFSTSRRSSTSRISDSFAKSASCDSIRHAGLLPLLGSHLPDHPSKADRPWLSMPIATPIAKSLAGRPLTDVVAAVAAVADTLACLQADFDIAHRDIKPGNLYELDGDWLIGDFGLIALPDAETLTQDGRQVGPAHYTAYEMILSPTTAEPHPADVYSLGKTLWVLATGQAWPPEGTSR